MTEVTYRIVQHDGGWAYKLGGTFSETYPDHDSARSAAARAASEQRVSDHTAYIEYENAHGVWITERADGSDRPQTQVEG